MIDPENDTAFMERELDTLFSTLRWAAGLAVAIAIALVLE